MSEPSREVLIVGAGVAGLACARALAEAGRPALLLERARGVGGRCATRRLEGQPLDHGPAFLHGSDPGFLAALAAVPATALPGWPSGVSGTGQPCQAEAFRPGEVRLAFAEGVNAFPRHLATGLEVRLEAEVTTLEEAGSRLRLQTAAGQPLEAPAVVLALAAEQAGRLLGTLPAALPEVRGARALLDLSRSHACLALLAVYGEEAPRPGWQVCYPEASRALQLVSHDSSKRPAGARVALVLQARPAWSRAHLEDPAWPVALLEEAGRVLGPWAARPAASHAHRWRHARTDRAAELAGPLLLTLPGGGRLGVCGDRFAPGGGVEAAWRSGRLMAARLLQGAWPAAGAT
ncbi:MAG: FAD-dependent oxidoreductase [Anaeromyxobacter sp.]|nr:FAD-dependent oxidoreductase [Anaeromyxobacter sp.]MBL0274921.1 FAD-dependent oxidoreductase [Anaeromyxobacter sp.]